MGEAPWRNRHRTVGSPEKAGLACKNGCDQVIEYRKEDFGARMKEITNREGCQVVYEGVGQATFPASLDCLRRFGKFVSFASASRPIEAFDIMLLAEKGRSSPSGRCCPCISPGARTFLPCEDLFQVVASGTVKIPVYVRMPLAEAPGHFAAGDEMRAIVGRTGCSLI